MESKERIHLHEALAEMDRISMSGGTFLLAFVRAHGRQKGSIKFIARARRGGLRPGGTNKQKKNVKGPLYKWTGQIPITDVEKKQYLTPLRSHIVQFQNKEVWH